MIAKPHESEHAPYFANYIDLVPENDGLLALENSFMMFGQLTDAMSPSMWRYRYAPEKWSVNEVAQHLIDTEIIFLNRALRIARADKTPLPGFDHDAFVPQSQADYQSLTDIVALGAATRNLTVALFKSLPENSLQNLGTASGHNCSPRALCFMISGHMLHHIHIIKERYLP